MRTERNWLIGITGITRMALSDALTGINACACEQLGSFLVAEEPRSCLLVGPCGSGKTSVCREAARAQGYELGVLQHDSGCTHAQCVAMLDTAVFGRTISDILTGTKKLVLIDDVDVVMGYDRLFAAQLGKVLVRLRTAPRPWRKLCVVCASEDPRKLPLPASLRAKFDVTITMGRPEPQRCLELVRELRPSVSLAAAMRYVHDNRLNLRDLLINLPNLDATACENGGSGVYEAKGASEVPPLADSVRALLSPGGIAAAAAGAGGLIRRVDALTCAEPLLAHALFENFALHFGACQHRCEQLRLCDAHVQAAMLESGLYTCDSAAFYNLPAIVTAASVTRAVLELPASSCSPSHLPSSAACKSSQALTRTAIHYSIEKKARCAYARTFVSPFAQFLIAHSAGGGTSARRKAKVVKAVEAVEAAEAAEQDPEAEDAAEVAEQWLSVVKSNARFAAHLLARTAAAE